MDETYEIFRSYAPKYNRETEVVKTGLTLEEAQEYCSDPDTAVEGYYFEGYRKE